MSDYLRNGWYASGWADELQPGRMLARTVTDRPLLIYRAESGAAFCLFDRCPHRFAPLSRGKLEGESVRCNYHGMRFGGSGACVENPHGAVVSALRVASFPLVERHEILWVWLGEGGAADPGAHTGPVVHRQVAAHGDLQGIFTHACASPAARGQHPGSDARRLAASDDARRRQASHRSAATSGKMPYHPEPADTSL